MVPSPPPQKDNAYRALLDGRNRIISFFHHHLDGEAFYTKQIKTGWLPTSRLLREDDLRRYLQWENSMGCGTKAEVLRGKSGRFRSAEKSIRREVVAKRPPPGHTGPRCGPVRKFQSYGFRLITSVSPLQVCSWMLLDIVDVPLSVFPFT